MREWAFQSRSVRNQPPTRASSSTSNIIIITRTTASSISLVAETLTRTEIIDMMLTSTMIDSGFDSAPSSSSNGDHVQTMSRTHQYRKVMKPLLERKRRARINKCLDELKDLMVTALQTEGESITKLEKADVLELTVRHLRKLKRQNALGLTPQATYAGKFKSGYAHCAQEVSKFMSQAPSMDVQVSTQLLSHLSGCMQALDVIPPSTISVPPSPASPPFVSGPEEALDLTSRDKKREPEETLRHHRRQPSNDSESSGISSGESKDEDKSWRPWWKGSFSKKKYLLVICI